MMLSVVSAIVVGINEVLLGTKHASKCLAKQIKDVDSEISGMNTTLDKIQHQVGKNTAKDY